MADRYDVMVVLPSNTEGGKGFWYKIGTAFAMRNGGGYSVELAAMPLPINGRCRLILMDAERNRDRNRQPTGGGSWPTQNRMAGQDWQRSSPRQAPPPSDFPGDQPPPARDEHEEMWGSR